ncbi:PREDICTED: uncharacterized protein LOC109215232 isoform X3 [Nicotiana attenuata]|uniref:uncharacterized protein LOC109215232 isoform X3 n=1 Tax=Nicotiana attenuata TaxID=49451 RepID=UPI000905968F|nr:PREDICTED: uncharacterized protein LOC109215232 isoform X3 [Nicotiana attenuata]
MAKVEVAEMQSSVHENDKNVLEFMDSTDSYLVLMNSLSSSLRQGWFELASARHSMGASRINSALFDLKSHSAATTLQLNNLDAGPELEKLHFSLCKWASSESPKSSSEEAKFEEDKLLQRKSSSPKVLKQDGSSNSATLTEVQAWKCFSLSVCSADCMTIFPTLFLQQFVSAMEVQFKECFFDTYSKR